MYLSLSIYLADMYTQKMYIYAFMCLTYYTLPVYAFTSPLLKLCLWVFKTIISFCFNRWPSTVSCGGDEFTLTMWWSCQVFSSSICQHNNKHRPANGRLRRFSWINCWITCKIKNDVFQWILIFKIFFAYFMIKSFFL